MSATDQPKVGDERITLVAPKRKGGKHVLNRMVWVERGFTTFYDSAALDWVQWNGSWVVAEELGRFANRDEARNFMLIRNGRERES
jgi:hypothetical protein